MNRGFVRELEPSSLYYKKKKNVWILNRDFETQGTCFYSDSGKKTVWILNRDFETQGTCFYSDSGKKTVWILNRDFETQGTCFYSDSRKNKTLFIANTNNLQKLKLKK